MSQPSINTGTNQSGATLQGLFKQVYAKSVKDAIPNFSIIQKRIPFSKAELLGDKYHLPVVLADEHGFTYSNAQGANYNLNSAIAMQMEDAQVSGSELTLQSGLSYGAVKRASAKGDVAVESAVRLLIERMKASASKRVEIELLYGASPTGIGSIASGTGSGTSRVYTISAATFASGVWSGMENANLDVVSSSAVVNTNAPLVISAVDVTAKTVSVTGNATDLTAIDAAIAGGASFFFYGAFGNEMTGLEAILLNTGSLFNINAASFNLWKANQYDCSSAALTMSKVLSGLSQAVARGLMDDVALFVAPDSFANLVNDLAAQRRFDGTYKSKKAENGFETITFYGQSGMIEIIPHAMLKSSQAMAIPLDAVQRVGSCDVEFRGETNGGETEYLFQNPTTNGWICRAYTDQAIFIESPAHCVLYKNITPSS